MCRSPVVVAARYQWRMLRYRGCPHHRNRAWLSTWNRDDGETGSVNVARRARRKAQSVAEIVARRRPQTVFVLDADARVSSWSRPGDGTLPADLVPLIDTYFAQSADQRGEFNEIIDIGADRFIVCIAPSHHGGDRVYLVVLQPFAIRRDDAGSDRTASSTHA